MLAGTAFIGLYDLRAGSPTGSRKVEISIAEKGQRYGQYVPPGVAHGFFAEIEALAPVLGGRLLHRPG